VTILLSITDVLLLVIGSVASASHFWLFVIGFHIERFYQPTQRMFSLTALLLSYSVMMMTLATSPLGVEYPFLLVGPSFVSGFIASSFMIYISGVVHPLRPASRYWLLLGIPGVAYAIMACSLEGALIHLSAYVHEGKTVSHPILSPMFFAHVFTVFISIGTSIFLIQSGFKNLKDARQRSALLWLAYGIVIATIMIIFGNIVPLLGFPSVLKFVPMCTIPIGLLCYRSLQVQAGLSSMDKLDGKAAAEKRLESLGRMAHGVSHDINNMLTSVMGSAELIRVKTKSNHDLEVHLNQILDSSFRAGQLMEGMLSFSGRGRTPKSIRPNNLIFESIQAARAQCPDNIALLYELEEELPWIRIAPQDLVNAILNLALNGIDAIEKNKKGSVFIKAQYREESIIPESAFGSKLDGHPTMLITVRDNGCGMDEQTQAHIYEPFFSTKKTGRGLGLMSVFSIVQHYGGAIFCESKFGVGKVFKLWIPISEPSIESTKDLTSNFQYCQLILVEDNYDVRSVIEELLRTVKITVRAYSSAEDALEAMDTCTVDETDLYLLDIRLNGLSGIDLAYKILEKNSTARILFMSGDEHEHTMEQFKDNNHIAFMRKPINMNILNEALMGLGVQQRNRE
jgi:signal transduction histidine kinase/ActR/RegA family two-component response regulator